MKNLSLSKKIIKICSIMAAFFIVAIETKFLVQSIYAVRLIEGSKVDVNIMAIELGVVLGLGVVAFFMIMASNFAQFKSERSKKWFSISVITTLLLNLILAMVFYILNAKGIVSKFIIGSTKRNITYFFYHIKKLFILAFLTIFISVAEFSQNLSANAEKKRQAVLYGLITTIVFINSMFLMVTILDAKAAKIFDNKFMIPEVVLSVLAFLISSMHIVVSIVQRRAIVNDNLSNKKIKAVGTAFNVLENGFGLIVLVLFNLMFNQVEKESYLIFVVLEYLMIFILITMTQLLITGFGGNRILTKVNDSSKQESIEREEKILNV